MKKIKFTPKILAELLLAAIFLIIAIISITYWESRAEKGDFVGSLLPEIIGLSLEGVIFVFILSIIQEIRDYSNKDQLRIGLEKHASLIMESLRNPNPLFGWDKHAIHAKPMKEFEEFAKKLHSEINQPSYDLSLYQIRALLQLSDQIYDTLLALVPVAADISPQHLIEWTSLISNIKNLKDQYRDIQDSKWPAKDDVAMQIQEFIQSALFISNLRKCPL